MHTILDNNNCYYHMFTRHVIITNPYIFSQTFIMIIFYRIVLNSHVQKFYFTACHMLLSKQLCRKDLLSKLFCFGNSIRLVIHNYIYTFANKSVAESSETAIVSCKNCHHFITKRFYKKPVFYFDPCIISSLLVFQLKSQCC